MSFTLIAAAVLAVLFMGGCATAIKYSYDTKASFSEQKSYTWVPSSAVERRDSLLERNVQALADQLLAQKGFTRVSEKPDLMMSMSYEYEFGSGLYQYSYQLRMLTLNIFKIKSDMPAMPTQKNSGENRELIWRGTAFGTINIDAASGDLKQALEGILLNFPPK
jgi:Domain of unknown function (DUF4136)